MSNNLKKFTLAAGFVATLAYLVGCGTTGENTGFKDTTTGPVTGLPGTVAAAAAAGTGGLTGGTTGTPVVNDAFPLTVATGLTISNMLAISGGSGNSNPPTRLAFATLTAFSGTTKVAAVQGFGIAAAGRVVLMPRNPDSTPGSSNIVLTPTGAGSDAPAVQNLNNPFGITVDGQTIYITDQSTNPASGRIMVYDNIQADGTCRGRQILTQPPLSSPVKIIKAGNFLYVAENAPRGGGGRIRKIDLTKPFTGDATNSLVMVDGVNYPTSIALDTTGGRNFLYISENGAGSASGAQGGVSRVNLAVAPFSTTGGNLLDLIDPTKAASGVTFIGATPAFNFPFDLAVDGFGNVVTTEGVSVAGVGQSLISPQFITGRIRVIQGGATPTATNATMVLQNAPPGAAVGITGSRGVSLNNEDATGTVISAFFTEGTGLATTCRQLTFRNTDGAIFRQLQLDSGRISPLDTLFDPGNTAAPVVAPNVKYCVGSFNGGTNGQILDIR